MCVLLLLLLLQVGGLGKSTPPVPSVDSRMLSCSRCKRMNHSDARFCDWCGSKVNTKCVGLVKDHENGLGVRQIHHFLCLHSNACNHGNCTQQWWRHLLPENVFTHEYNKITQIYRNKYKMYDRNETKMSQNKTNVQCLGFVE